MIRRTLGAVAFLSALAIPGIAMAATAIATTNVNLRAGPSTAYPAVNVVGGGDSVHVFGCLSTRSWCDVGYAGQRGWMSSNYMAFLQGGRRYTGDPAIVALRAPVVTFTVGDYWDRHYRSRSFYRDRARWDRRDWREERRDWREDRRDWREHRQEERRDWRGDRRDWREGRREERRDWREGRREDRKEWREERREERKDWREDRKEARKDRREDRKEARKDRHHDRKGENRRDGRREEWRDGRDPRRIYLEQ
ncbi:SH3 domain-containing protein [Pseudaminobacter sp. 19-2017]|uniref:SH3 domain-containing protein n=1 Tax=Pseudaminobacter soli (ex Zhang et al. 2022) TaxID=2831468 RepID=A0A942E316_9HYPH|nr:SH3 domain-containing protein [Pseudaminobacter soli]MBS3652213.1 SH3 domain-containing protein [Pseudaminobacter soli]